MSGCARLTVGAFAARPDANSVMVKVAGIPQSNSVSLVEGTSGTFFFSTSSVLENDLTLTVSISSARGDVMSAIGTTSISAVVPKGSNSGSFTIPSVVNSAYTGDRAFQITLAVADGSAVVSPSQFDVLLTDLQSPPFAQLSALAQSVSESAASGTATVTLAPPSSFPVSVTYAFSNGLAAKGIDYTGVDGTLTFAPGQTSKTISFGITDTHTTGSPRNFTLSLSALTGTGSISPAAAIQTITILEDDVPPVVQFAQTSASGYENAGPWTVTAQLSAACGQDVTVPLTVSGTALNTVDYTLSASTITIPAGSLSAGLTITSIDDSTVEPDETIVLTMGTPTGASLGSSDQFTFTLLNDDIGSFSISGIESAGGLDTTVDANLNFEDSPSVVFSAAAGATSYDVAIADSTHTVICTKSVSASPANLTSCHLTAGSSYTAKVTAKIGSVSSLAATDFSFRYNRAPVAAADQILLAADGAAVTFDPRANDSDADGDSLTIVGVGTPTGGTASYTSTSVTYTPATSASGVQTFTYTISDGHGAQATATITALVMTRYTWTGAAGDGLWSNAQNWCGSVSTPGVSGACAAGAGYPSDKTNSSHVAVFDGTATNSNATIDVNAQAYALNLGAGYSGTLTQSNAKTIDIGGGGWYQAAGTFTAAASGDITINATGAVGLDIEGGTFSGGNGSMLSVWQSGASGSQIINFKLAATITLDNMNVTLGGNATGSPTYDLFIQSNFTATNFANVYLQSFGGSSSDRLKLETISDGGHAWINVLPSGGITIGRKSGASTIEIDGGTNQWGFANYGSLLATDGARGGTVGFNGATTYGCLGDGVLPPLSAQGTPSSTDVATVQFASFSATATMPSGVLTITSQYQHASLYADPATNVNGGTVKVVVGGNYPNNSDVEIDLTFGSSSTAHLHNLIVDASSSTAHAIDPYFEGFTVDGDFTLIQTSSPIWNGNDLSVGGNVTLSGITTSSNLGTLTLNGSSAQTLTFASANNFGFRNVQVANSAGVNAQSDLSSEVGGTALFEVMGGAVLNMNGHAFTWGDNNPSDGIATFQIDTGATVNLGGGSLSSETLVNHGTLTP